MINLHLSSPMLLLLLLLPPPSSPLPSLTVTTTTGEVRGGWRDTSAGARLASYQGIPFAAPPTGDLRFSPPQPVEPRQGEMDVSADATVKCSQYGYMTDGDVPVVSGSEDCLYLNVYVPETAGPDKRLPVMMWIFGGYFNAGSQQWSEYGAMHWADQDVVLVAPNHRLGPFGFTSLGTPEAPGNQGLRDLVAALQWIQDNIAEFGGDQDSVTIFGESSGSWACSYLHLSPHAAGLFHRAILQSGSSLNPYWQPITEQDAVAQSSYLASRLGCQEDTALGRLQCLRDMDRDSLMASQNWGVEETLYIQKTLRATGVIEGDFLPDWPETLLEEGRYNHVDLMLGYTKDEALIQTLQMYLHPELLLLLKFQWNSVFGPMFLFGRYGPDITQEDQDMAAAITKVYLGGPPIFNLNMAHFTNLTDLISDAYIWYGAYREARGSVLHGDTVFQYQFNFKGEHGYAEAVTGNNTDFGVCHSDELYYFWRPYWYKAVLDNVGYTPEEAAVSSSVLELWSNFARTGHPTPEGYQGVAWQQVTEDRHQYLVIDTTMEMALTQEFTDRMQVWQQLYTNNKGNSWRPPEDL